MFKKIKAVFIISFIFIIALSGCGGAKSSTSVNSNSTNLTVLTQDEFAQIYSGSSKYDGRRVYFFARVFTEPVVDANGTYFQVYALDDQNKKTIIGIKDTQCGVKNGDILEIAGAVEKFEGVKYFGTARTAPSILAEEIEKFDYTHAFAPAIKTIQINKEINQNGYILKLNKIEVAAKETRLFINITNTTKNKVKLYSLKTNLTQGNKQLRKISNANEEIPEIDNDILPGVSQKGVLIFQPVEADGENLKIIFEGGSDNSKLNFTPFTFDAVLKK